MAEQWLADVVARLYALPLDEFVNARAAAAGEVPAGDGQRSGAKTVRSLPKPSVAAWTVNLLANRRPELLRELAGLGRSMRAAQAALEATELRRLGMERRQLLAGAVEAARTAAQEQGRRISAAITAEVEETLRAATADEGAAAAVQSGCLLRGLSADGVDVLDLAGAVALPDLLAAAPAAPGPLPTARAGTGAASGRTTRAGATTTGTGTGATTTGSVASGAPRSVSSGPRPEPGQPRLRAVREEPRRSTPSVLVRARAALEEAEAAARAAAGEALTREQELAAVTALALELAESVRSLREQLAEREKELKAARSQRELAAARAQQAARAAARASRTEDLARERVLRLGNTPD